MSFNQIFSALALLSLSAAASVSGSKVLSVPVVRQFDPSASIPLSLSKRSDDEVDVDISNQNYWYGIELGIGNPPQKVTFHLDTGSSDTWVDSKGFDPSKSSSYEEGTNRFSIRYGDKTSASGSYSTDDIIVGGATLKKGNFAFANKSDIPANTYVSGIGYTAGEATNTEYSNLPKQLKEQGYIDRIAYSLWLNDFNDDEGSILFGGVDHSKYEGKLSKLPVVSNIEAYADGTTFRPNTLTRLSVNLNSIGFSYNGASAKVVDNAAVPVLLDSGTTLGRLPKDWLDAIAATVGGEYISEVGLYATTNPLSGGTIDLEFSGVTIKSPINGFIRPWILNNGKQAQEDDGTLIYMIGCQAEQPGVSIDDGTIYILGDSFLSGAYMVFDLENNEIGLANAKLGTDASGSDIEAIGSNGIPGTTAAGYSTATVSNTKYDLHTPTGFY